MNNVKKVTEIKTRSSSVTLNCPHCDAEVEGWISDPRGVSETCEKCGNEYTVDSEAKVKID